MSKFNVTKFVVCLLILVMGLFTTQALSQSQASSGQLAGVVKDSAGAVIVGATVTAANTGTGFSQTVTTEESGFYRIVLLPAGSYKVTVSRQGFAEGVARVSVGVGRTTEVNFSLAVGGRKEEVTVTAEMIEATRHEAAAFVGATVISDMPLNGRRFQDAVLTTPTAAIDPTRGGITLTGQRMVNTGSINVDGADYGQLFFGGVRGGERAGFAPTIPLDSIQEFQIVRAGYTAEFGRSTGGTITAITKSGSNQIHGTAQYNIRPDSAASGNEFYDTIKSQLIGKGCTTCKVNPNPTLQQWSGAIGGPIKKDKIFFFGAYDQQRQRLPHQIFFDKLQTFVPTAATQEAIDAYNGGTANGITYPSLQVPFTQTNDAWLFLLKADWQLSNKHRLSVRYNHSNYEGANANSVGANVAPTVTAALSNNGTEIDKTRTLVGNLNSYFGHFANEFRGQYARETRPRPANALSPTVSNTVGNYGTVSFLGQNIEYDYRIQFADNITWIKGAHTFKFGGEYNHLYAAQTFGFNQFGQFNSTTTSVATVLTVLGKRFDDTTARYTKQVGNLQVAYPAEQIAAFFQDSWRIKPNFTINYGLRWEAALNPTAATNGPMVPLVQPVTFPNGRTVDPTKVDNQTNQFAPRLGFAWNPMGDGKTVIRGFGGIYFAATPQLLFSNTVGDYRDPPANLSVQLPLTIPTGRAIPAGCPGLCNTVFQQFQLAGINLNTGNNGGPFPLNALPVLTNAQIIAIGSAVLGSTSVFPGSAPITTANGFRNPRSYQAGFGIERQLALGWTVAVEGAWIKTVHLERDIDLNTSACAGAISGSAGGCANPANGFDLAGRGLYGLSNNSKQRVIPQLGAVTLRDSTGKSLYRGLTLRTSLNRKWGVLNAYYTLSENISDDDNERNAGGFFYNDPFNFGPDYNYSDLNRRHQFVVSPVFFLPWGFEVSNNVRLLSGSPVNPTIGFDANQDAGSSSNDRPYLAVGQIMKRNSFQNRALSFVDMRIQKSIKLTESKQLKLSAEIFNLFNFMNLTYSGTTVSNFCQALPTALNPTNSTTINATCGVPAFFGLTQATNGWTNNTNFLHLRDATGTLLTNNNAGVPREAQFTVKFVF